MTRLPFRGFPRKGTPGTVVTPPVENVLAANNPSFELANLTGYSAFGGTYARRTEGGAAHKSTYLRLTCTTAGNVRFFAPKKAAVPGSRWAAGNVMRWGVGGVRRSTRVDILFQNSVGTEIGAGQGLGVTPLTTEWGAASREMEHNGVLEAPEGTATVQLRVVMVAAAVGDAVDMDMLQLNAADNLATYTDRNDPTEPLDTVTNPGGGLNLVQPMSAQEMHDKVGINTMFNKNQDVHVYKSDNQTVAFNFINEASFYHVRGSASNKATRGDVATNARSRGLKMVWIVDEENGLEPSSIKDLNVIREMIDWIAAYAHDVTHAIEGLNEPNHNRDDNTTTLGWENTAFEHQKVVSDQIRGAPSNVTRTVVGAVGGNTFTNKARLAHVKLIGPSLHDDRARSELMTIPSRRTGYATLAQTGIAPYMDYLGLHAYAGGKVPSDRLQSRLDLIRASTAFGANYPVFATEVGYHDAMDTPKGHWPAPQDVQAVYAPRLFIQMCGRKLDATTGTAAVWNFTDVTWFELLDDRDSTALKLFRPDGSSYDNPLPGANDDQEASFGIIDTVNTSDATATNTANWTRKSSFNAIKEFLTRLDDPGSSYTPVPIGLELSYDTSAAAAIKYFIVRKRGDAGQAFLFLFRDLSVWNVGGRYNNTVGTPITVPSLPVIVEDSLGTRNISVNASVSVVPIGSR